MGELGTRNAERGMGRRLEAGEVEERDEKDKRETAPGKAGRM